MKTYELEYVVNLCYLQLSLIPRKQTVNWFMKVLNKEIQENKTFNKRN